MLIKKIFLSIILSLIISSCTLTENFKDKINSWNIFNKNQEQQDPEIRIVGLNGKYRPIKKYKPRLNQQTTIAPQNNNNLSQSVAPQNTNPQNYGFELDNQELQLQEQLKRGDDFADNFGPSSAPLVSQGSAQSFNDNIRKPAGSQLKQEQSQVKKAPVTYNNEKTQIKSQDIKGTFIQIGYYSSKIGAQKTLNKGQKINNAVIKEVLVKNRKLYKVLLGPIKTKKGTRSTLNRAKRAGFKDAFITKIK